MSYDRLELCGSFFDENFCATYHKKLPQFILFGSLKLVVVEHPEIIGVFVLLFIFAYVIFLLVRDSGSNWLSSLISNKLRFFMCASEFFNLSFLNYRKVRHIYDLLVSRFWSVLANIEIIDEEEQDMLYDYWDALEGNEQEDPDNNRSLVEMQDQLLSINSRREFVAEVNNGTGYLAFGGKLMQKSFYYVNKHVLFTTEEIPNDFATSMKFASATNIIEPTSCSSYIHRCKSVQNVITKGPLSAKTRSRTTKISRNYPKDKF